MNSSVIVGVGMVLLGIIILYQTIKKPEKGKDVNLFNFRGYFWGSACIISGILLIFRIIEWK